MADNPGAWRILDERLIYEHRPWLRLVEQDVQLPNGVVIEKYLLSEMSDVVMIFAVTMDGHVLFVEQYKHGIGRLSLDLSAGYMDAEDPSPLAAASPDNSVACDACREGFKSTDEHR